MSPEEIVPAEVAAPEKPKAVRRKRIEKKEEAVQPALLADVTVGDAPAKPKRAPRKTAAEKTAELASAEVTADDAPVKKTRGRKPAVTVDAVEGNPSSAPAAPTQSAPENTTPAPTQTPSVAPVVTPSVVTPAVETPAPVNVAPSASDSNESAPGQTEAGGREFIPRAEGSMRYESRAERFANRERNHGPRENFQRDNAPQRENLQRDSAQRDNAQQRENAPQAENGGVSPENRVGENVDGFNGGERPFDSDRQFDGDRNFEGRLRFRGNRNQLRRERNNNRNNRFGGGLQGEGNFGNQNQPARRREYEILGLQNMELEELNSVGAEFSIENPPEEKDALIYAILEAQAYTQNALLKRGFLEILSDGKGFLRCDGYLPNDGDVYVSQSQIKRFNLKTGDLVLGTVRTPKEMERFHGLLRVEAINGLSPEVMKQRKEFEKLTPIFPNEKFQLETEPGNITARIIDLVSPIGKGSRGLIVAPPKAGKTTLIKNVANSIAKNHPEVVLIVLLIDERPEEVTDISRSIRGEVVASTFDEMPDNHMRVADIVLEKAKRLVEMKQDVVILMDSITRLSRASNLVVTPSGRTLSGGLDPAAMYRPKRMFGAARNIEEGGSLTILATALVDTGSRMDEMIFEEFKGTGNLDLVLDRSLFDQRIFPAIDINRSGTRRDDLLFTKDDMANMFHFRRTMAPLDNDKAVTLLIDRLKNTKSNADFMQVVAKSARNAGNGAG